MDARSIRALRIIFMRLTPAQIDTIKTTATAVLGEGVQVTLFGSRVHDTQKGGARSSRV